MSFNLPPVLCIGRSVAFRHKSTRWSIRYIVSPVLCAHRLGSKSNARVEYVPRRMNQRSLGPPRSVGWRLRLADSHSAILLERPIHLRMWIWLSKLGRPWPLWGSMGEVYKFCFPFLIIVYSYFISLGKTTLAKVLTGLYDYEGSLLIDGIEAKTYKRESLYKYMTVCPQNIVAFPLTIRENIGLGKVGDMDDTDSIMRAVRRGGAEEVIKTHGLNKILAQVLCCFWIPEHLITVSFW